jgi:hypothetical protein
MKKILFVDDEFTEKGYHVITPNDSQPIKPIKEKIILPQLFREQIEQGIKGLCHDTDGLKGGL